MNIETLINLGLSEEASLSLLSEIESALSAEYERGLREGQNQLEEFKFNQAVAEILSDTDAKNPEVLKALIDFNSVSFENGEITGLSEQIDAIRQENPFLFDDGSAPKFTRRPKTSDEITKKDFDNMAYADRVKLFSKNPALYKSLKG